MTRRPSPRLRLRAVRSHRDWSEADLAERIRRLAAYLGQPDPGVTAALVAQWEAGALVAPARLSLWCAALGVPVSEAVALVDPLQLPPMLTSEQGAGSVGAGVERRDFLRLMATASGMATFDPERLAEAISERARVDLGLVTDLAASIRQLSGLWDSMPAPLLRRTALAHLETARTLLAGPLPPYLRRELMATGGSAAALAGQVSRMLGRDDDTHFYLLLAGQLSGGAGATDVQALALVWSADTLSGVQRGAGPVADQAAVVAMLERAEALAGPSAPSSVREFVALRLAEEHAVSGDVAEAARCLERARTVLAQARPGDPGLIGAGWGDAIVHDMFKGNVELLSGRPAEAVAVLDGVMERMPADYVSGRSSALADLAAAHARLGDLEQAVSRLASAWAIADRAGLEDRRRRVLGVRRRDLGRWAQEPAVRRLDEQHGL